LKHPFGARRALDDDSGWSAIGANETTMIGGATLTVAADHFQYSKGAGVGFPFWERRR
jgi:hypothetical protein